MQRVIYALSLRVTRRYISARRLFVVTDCFVPTKKDSRTGNTYINAYRKVYS